MSTKVNTKEFSESRIGCYCMYCQTAINPLNAIAVPSKSNGKKRYICRSCGHMHGYCDENNDSTHKQCKHQIQFGIEFEGGYPYESPVVNGITLDTESAINHYITSNYHLLPSADSTVECEFKSPRYYNLHGFKQILQSISQVFDLTTMSSGTHINISKLTWDYNTGDIIESFGTELFSKLGKYLKSHRNECIQIFGRYFKVFCEYSETEFMHGDWIAIKQDNYTNESCIEFRLAKFQNVKQYFQLVNYCAEVTDIIDKWVSRYNPYDTTEKRIKAAQKVGDKILFKFYEYQNSQAQCQKYVRNSCEW